jgi:hypothetical protein
MPVFCHKILLHADVHVTARTEDEAYARITRECGSGIHPRVIVFGRNIDDGDGIVLSSTMLSYGAAPGAQLELWHLGDDDDEVEDIDRA